MDDHVHARAGRGAPLAAALATALALAAGPAAAPAEGLLEAVGAGKVSGEVRYRYEAVDQGGLAENAAASTLRTRLGYRTGTFGRLTGFIEFENVVTVDGDEYNSGTNGRTAFPVVADPAGSEMNQVYLEIAPAEAPRPGARHPGPPRRRNAPDADADAGATVRVGRQRIALDNERHVGSVGWRQNEQTFDAASVVDALPSGLVLTYAYLWNVNGVDRSDAAQDSHLLHARYTASDQGTLSMFDYLVNDDDAPTRATQTYGARYGGRLGDGERHGVIVLEYARQGAYAGSGVGHSTYRLGALGTEGGAIRGKVAYEVLGGDGADAFQTPLGTRHAFNGWADKFLTTPPAGLADLAFSLTASAGRGTLTAAWHKFTAHRGGADYGTELDLMLVTKPGGQPRLGAAYARYEAEGFATDTEKIWAFAEAPF